MEIFSQIDWMLATPILIIELVLVTIALIDWFRKGETNGPKWVWLLVILFISILGPVIYFIFGRRQQ